MFYGGRVNSALATLAITIAYSLFRLVHGTGYDFLKAWFIGFIFIVSSAGIGKLVGLWVGRLRFRWVCVRLIRLMEGGMPRSFNEQGEN